MDKGNILPPFRPLNMRKRLGSTSACSEDGNRLLTDMANQLSHQVPYAAQQATVRTLAGGRAHVFAQGWWATWRTWESVCSLPTEPGAPRKATLLFKLARMTNSDAHSAPMDGQWKENTWGVAEELKKSVGIKTSWKKGRPWMTSSSSRSTVGTKQWSHLNWVRDFGAFQPRKTNFQ